MSHIRRTPELHRPSSCRIHQRPTRSRPLHLDVDRDDLEVAVPQRVGEEAEATVVIEGDEPVQGKGIDQVASARDLGCLCIPTRWSDSSFHARSSSESGRTPIIVPVGATLARTAGATRAAR